MLILMKRASPPAIRDVRKRLTRLLPEYAAQEKEGVLME
jgi:hypothetical protein